MYEPAAITQIIFLDGFQARLTFTNDAIREVDLAPYLQGPIFDPIRTDPAVFRAATVIDGTITWPNGADIDPDVLYLGLPPHASEAAWQAAIAAETTQHPIR